jgi:hypothetical protein
MLSHGIVNASYVTGQISLIDGVAVGLLAPSQRYSTIKKEEACQF